MNIVVITSSPNEAGTSALLADEFIRGAREAGHDIFRFDAGKKAVGACLACQACGCGAEPCVQEDDMQELHPALVAADAVVFASPIYYFGMTAQMKLVIDRFYAVNEHLRARSRKAALLLTAASDNAVVVGPAVNQYECMLGYLGWQDGGRVLALGCPVRTVIEQSDFPRQAYELGKSF